MIPVGCLARGDAARALIARLLALPDDRLPEFAGVGNADLVVILGREVPWVDGAIWLGRHPEAPALLLPTATPTRIEVDGEVVAPDLLEAAVLRRVGAGPVVVLPDLLVPVGGALPLGRARLGAWPG